LYRLAAVQPRMAKKSKADAAPTLRRLRTKTAVPSLKRPPTEPAVLRKAKESDGMETGAVLKRGRFVLKERHTDYVIVRSALSEEHLRFLDDYLKLQTPEPARMKNEGEGADDHERKIVHEDRNCEVFWFHLRDHLPAMQQHFAEILRDVANVEWPLFKVRKSSGDVVCEWEQTQYTVYGPKQHFFCWHQDAYADGHDQEDARQFALVVMLSKKEEYGGGAFEMKLPAPSGRKGMFLRRSVRLDAGDVVVFPTKTLIHRVRPVTKGLRRTLVFWANDRMSCHFYNPKLNQQRKKRSK